MADTQDVVPEVAPEIQEEAVKIEKESDQGTELPSGNDVEAPADEKAEDAGEAFEAVGEAAEDAGEADDAGDNAEAARAKLRRVKGSEVFVGCLAREVVETDITEMFSAVGEIVELRLMKDINGAHKGYAFVRYPTKEAAQEAIQKLNKQPLKGKEVVVNLSTDQDTIFLGNLKKEWTQQEFDGIVQQAFEGVKDVQLAVPNVVEEDQPNKKLLNRGFAFVQFEDHQAAVKAYKAATKPDFQLGGSLRPVVDWADMDPEPSAEEMAKVKTAFLRNLPAGVTEEFLKPLFEPFGEVEKVAISNKNPSVPVAFISFTERAHVDAAIEALNNTLADGPNDGPKFKIQVALAKPVEKAPKKRPHEHGASGRDGARYQSGGSLSKAPRTSGYFRGEGDSLKPTDAFEAAIVALHPSVAQRLLSLFKSSTITRQDIDVRTLDSLRELPPDSSLNVLDQFTSSNLSIVRNKAAYLQGIINNTRRQLKDRVPYSSSRDRVSGSSASENRYAASRYYSGRSGSGGYSHYPSNPYVRNPYATRGYPEETSRAAPRFDPITGQPFMFDPYTGEPISSKRRYY